MCLSLLFLSLMGTSLALDYYPPGYFDPLNATKITWAHAVNSQKMLDENLKNSAIHMLEADIVMGTLNNSNHSEPIPIMAHPPNNKSDLSFERFVEQVVEHNKDLPLPKRKGIKLDFKDMEAARNALPQIKMKYENTSLEFPIWINADVLQGPVNASESKMDGEEVIQLQKDNVPNGTLSLGWTTRFGKQDDGTIIKNGTYTEENVEQMVNLLNTHIPDDGDTAYITFPLRAAIALNSQSIVLKLLDEPALNHTSLSITLWEGSADPPLKKEKLDEFIKAINESRVFLDLPYSLGNADGGQSSLALSNFALISLIIFSFVLY